MRGRVGAAVAAGDDRGLVYFHEWFVASSLTDVPENVLPDVPENVLALSAGRCGQLRPCALLSTTFLESLAASWAQLALVRLEAVRYRIIVPILHIATVSEHIGSTSPLLLQSAPVACGTSVLGGHTRR